MVCRTLAASFADATNQVVRKIKMTRFRFSGWPAVVASLLVAVTLAACGGGDASPNAQAMVAQRVRQAPREGAFDVRAMLMREPLDVVGPVLSRDEVKRAPPNRHRYFISDLGSLGGTQSFAYAINARAQVVGQSRLAGDAATHSFLSSDGELTDLFPLNSEGIQTVGPTNINDAGVVASGVISEGLYRPALMDTATGAILVLPCFGGATGGFSGVATAVSNSGVVVGYCYLNDHARHAFVHRNGVTSDIDGFGGNSVAMDVNDDGMVAGFVSRESLGVAGAFVHRAGTMTEIFPAGTESFGRSINRHGHVVGEYLTTDGSAFRAFLYRNGRVVDLGSNDSRDTVAMAVNDNDEVVGLKVVRFESTCSGVPCSVSKQLGFVWKDGRMSFLDALVPPNTDWELNWAFDINNQGQIVGYGMRDGRFRAFLLTPATSPQQCKDGAWRTFGFSNQGHCVAFVVAAKAN